MPASTALLTDHYELTMLQASLSDGTADRRSVFELFARRLPPGRRYGVVAGTGRALDALEHFRFGEAEVAWLRDHDVVDATTCDWLAEYRFGGDVWGYPEGEMYFPSSPVMVVEGTFAETVLLETLLLSVLNHDSAVASAAARMVGAAAGRPASRWGRAAPRSGPRSPRPGRPTSPGSPPPPTSRRAAPTAFPPPARAPTRSPSSTTPSATRSRPRWSRWGPAPRCSSTPTTSPRRSSWGSRSPVPGSARCASTPATSSSLAHQVRAQLDQLGATGTRILVTSDLDERAIATLAAAPVDGYGVGTALVTGSGAPTSGFVYKLVAREDADGTLAPVAKKSTEKLSVGGRKYALRRRSASGRAEAEVIGIGEPPADDGDDRSLLVPLVESGRRVHHDTLDGARARHRAALDELPDAARRLSRGEPVIDTVFE